MIVVMKANASNEAVERVTNRAQAAGLSVHLSRGHERTIIGLIGDVRVMEPESLQALPEVDRVLRIMDPYKLASRQGQPEGSQVKVGNVVFGNGHFPVIAGPCAVESSEQLETVAAAVKAAGASALRGGAFKPRTSPYSFQVLGEAGLLLLSQMSRRFELPIVTEVMSPNELELVAEHADLLQVGARNMHNFSLLKELGKTKRPVMLKRGLAASIDEWLQAAEYLLSSGNDQVILCERGIRTFESYTRNTLDLSAVAAVKQLSHLPVIVDPSHAAGRWELVIPLSMAALAVGADGLMVEVHPCPASAVSDGPQSLLPERFVGLMGDLRRLAPLMGRTMQTAKETSHVG